MKKKVNLIFIHTHLQKRDLVAAFDVQTNSTQNLIGLRVQQRAAILRRANQLDNLAALGVRLQVSSIPTPNTDRFSLAALVQSDTPEAHALLVALEAAQEAAERVNAQRGKAVPAAVLLGPDEPRGTDYAEGVGLLAARLRTEIHGPRVNGSERRGKRRRLAARMGASDAS